MPDITVTRMTREDVDAVHAIEAASFSTPWSRDAFEKEVTENACARYLVLKEDGVPVAFAGMWLVIDEGHVMNIAVRPDRRGLGYGKKVTQALIQLAADTGMTLMTLECRRSNTVAQRMYHSLGFVDVGYRKRYYENDEDALIMYLSQMPEGHPEDDPDLICEDE